LRPSLLPIVRLYALTADFLLHTARLYIAARSVPRHRILSQHEADCSIANGEAHACCSTANSRWLTASARFAGRPCLLYLRVVFACCICVLHLHLHGRCSWAKAHMTSPPNTTRASNPPPPPFPAHTHTNAHPPRPSPTHPLLCATPPWPAARAPTPTHTHVCACASVCITPFSACAPTHAHTRVRISRLKANKPLQQERC